MVKLCIQYKQSGASLAQLSNLFIMEKIFSLLSEAKKSQSLNSPIRNSSIFVHLFSIREKDEVGMKLAESYEYFISPTRNFLRGL